MSKAKKLQITEEIIVKGATTNNLKNVDLSIPKNNLIVVTGVSGSGKSSLVMDVLFAEGQRRYVESLSSYARQFLSRMKKPEVDYINGLSPAIAIEQKVVGGNARSTVGTMTEIYEYMRMLYARIGITYSPISGNVVKKHTATDVVEYVKKLPEGEKLLIFIPLHSNDKRTIKDELRYVMEKGFPRMMYKGEIIRIEEFIDNPPFDLSKTLDSKEANELNILIDRIIADNNEETLERVADSAQTAFNESTGICRLMEPGEDWVEFNNRFELDGISFIFPTPQLFNFNNSLGACKKCEGYGRIIGIDPAKVIPDTSKSIFEGAVACWNGLKFGKWKDELIMHSGFLNFPIHRPYMDLSEEEKELLWNGNEHFPGIMGFFDELQAKSYKIQNRVLLARYRGRTTCDECKGGRLRKEASYVKIAGKNLMELVELPIDKLYDFFKNLSLSEHQKKVAKRLLTEIKSRLKVMKDVGLGYLTLNRLSNTLSGGETQRINLTRILGSNLTNSLYILDEPSIGLHPKDINLLVKVLKKLRNLENTVIVVEHEENIIANADYIVDIGPFAGIHGGEIVFSGSIDDFKKLGKKNLTSAYFNGIKYIDIPAQKRKLIANIFIKNARKHNLKGIDVKIPMNALTVISGVSGSGKSTLVKEILEPGLNSILSNENLNVNVISGDVNLIKQVEYVNQKPIGKSSRSNPVTYVKAYDHIRKLFSSQQLSKIRGYKPGYFSFNTDGGRCETCKGEGEINVEMQFLADIKLVCDECGGKRFKKEILEVQYRGKNIYDVLNMTIEEALVFFNDHKEITKRLKALDEVGLGYVKLGQSSNTLSGGEAQRIKLASFLSKREDGNNIFFIFDEPTTGLHYHDVAKLLDSLNALVERGHTVLVIEHNLDVIRAADWVIDLGPEGGDKGGNLVFQGRVEDLVNCEESYTGRYLRNKIK
jgi:excinuclease ABC subunit A